MITEQLFIYFLFQIIILSINLLGYSKIPILSFFGIIATIVIAAPTLISFDTYYMFAAVLILINISLPTISLVRTFR